MWCPHVIMSPICVLILHEVGLHLFINYILQDVGDEEELLRQRGECVPAVSWDLVCQTYVEQLRESTGNGHGTWIGVKRRDHLAF